MQIYVCVKHVPDTAANIRVTGDAEFDESVKFVVNPFDEYGIEEAVRIVKKNGGEVVILTVGKAEAVSTIRAIMMQQSVPMTVTMQTVFIRSLDDAPKIRRLMEAYYGDRMPTTSFIVQPPCGGQALAIDGTQNAWPASSQSSSP